MVPSSAGNTPQLELSHGHCSFPMEFAPGLDLFPAGSGLALFSFWGGGHSF
jgi:hypothetical protein